MMYPWNTHDEWWIRQLLQIKFPPNSTAIGFQEGDSLVVSVYHFCWEKWLKSSCDLPGHHFFPENVEKCWESSKPVHISTYKPVHTNQYISLLIFGNVHIVYIVYYIIYIYIYILHIILYTFGNFNNGLTTPNPSNMSNAGAPEVWQLPKLPQKARECWQCWQCWLLPYPAAAVMGQSNYLGNGTLWDLQMGSEIRVFRCFSMWIRWMVIGGFFSWRFQMVIFHGYSWDLKNDFMDLRMGFHWILWWD